MRKNRLISLTAIVAAVVVCGFAAASSPPDIDAPPYSPSDVGAGIGFSVPPPDTPSGPSTGKVGQKLTYSTKGSDPLGVHDYMFDWGDATASDWDDKATQSHIYRKAGTFRIRAKEKCPADVFVTDWSDPKTVKISSNLAKSYATGSLSREIILLGSSACLSVRVTGSAGTPTGRVNFEVMKRGGSWRTYQTDVLLVSGRARSRYYGPTTAGDYYLRGYYRGSRVYAASRSSSQRLRVKASTKTTTILSYSTITLGQSVKDNARVSTASMTPTGSVTFQVKKDGAAAWTQIGSSVSLSDARATSSNYTPPTAGAYNFRALYSGDTYHTPSRSAWDAEPLTVRKADSATGTQLSDIAIALGSYVTDTATVTGLGGQFPDPTGTVDFQVSDDDGATWTTFDSDQPLVTGTAMSSQHGPPEAGPYLFRAVYSGDANYKPSQSADQDEPLTVDAP